ncbi:BTB/POZ domain-containing protein 3-like [Paramacrobiotus metropolitanus]|uniref:BTB/POZ domain-containing protein 3-like n=1 Tax=Paramacrobiotus metropolitanus TaxID=2943436 RepID=UPI00244582F1|nr:BTB/POZ domain-containing protein 3-like [Paramacrobiotus metropolitanus]
MSESSTSSNGAASSQRRGALGPADRMQRMLESGDLSDVQFEIGRHFGSAKTFRVHKYMLSSSSDVFHTMFCGSLPEKCAAPIDIPDVPPAAFQRMREFIYTESIVVTTDDVFPTMQCADKYDLPRLVDRCCDFVFKDLRISNCLLHAENALAWPVHTDNSMVENCLHFVDMHCEEVLQSEQFTQLKHTTVRKIVERDTLSVHENVIYAAVDTWAVAACTRDNLEPSVNNRRQVLGDILYLIRFPLMTDAQLADGPAGSGLLLPSEVLEIYLYRHAATVKGQLRFTTQSRNFPIIRVGDMAFREQEEIFVERSQHWSPAHVVGVRGLGVVCQLPYSKQTVVTAAEKFVRASDILASGQKILWSAPSLRGRYVEVTYKMRHLGGHRVNVLGTERVVLFGDIAIKCDSVEAWKRAQEESAERNTSGDATRKRSLDAANLA